MRRQDHHQSRAFVELTALILNVLRSPPTPIDFPDEPPAVHPPQSVSPSRLPPQITPAGFASLLLGISLTLMLCGSITFFIGFMLMPWILGLVMVFYVVAILSSLSFIGRAILCHATSPAAPPRKEVRDLLIWKNEKGACVSPS